MPLLLLLISAHEVQALPLLLLLSDDRRLMIIEKLKRRRRGNQIIVFIVMSLLSRLLLLLLLLPDTVQFAFPPFSFCRSLSFRLIDRLASAAAAASAKIAKHSTCHKHYSLLLMKHAPDQLCCCIFYCSLIGTHVCALASLLVCLCPLPSSRGT